MIKNPTDMLAAIGIALYGERWQRPLAKALGIHDRQVRRWMSGQYQLAQDHAVFSKTEWLLAERIHAINMVAIDLERWR